MNRTILNKTNELFNHQSDVWLNAKTERDNYYKSINSKLKLIESRKKRIEKLKQDIESDICGLHDQIKELEEFILSCDEEMEKAHRLMYVARGGSL